VYIERCKHGFGRGLRKPTAETRKGGALLLYFHNPEMGRRSKIPPPVKSDNLTEIVF
jgi:hypothetical protein